MNTCILIRHTHCQEIPPGVVSQLFVCHTIPARIYFVIITLLYFISRATNGMKLVSKQWGKHNFFISFGHKVHAAYFSRCRWNNELYGNDLARMAQLMIMMYACLYDDSGKVVFSTAMLRNFCIIICRACSRRNNWYKANTYSGALRKDTNQTIYNFLACHQRFLLS